MIAYKYKLYHTRRTKHLDRMLREACFVWNHALSLQRRYYRLFGKYIPSVRMQKHFARRIRRHLLGSQTVQEILQRLDAAYMRFFKHLAARPPKFRRARDWKSFVFKQAGYRLSGNAVTVNRLGLTYRFALSRPYEGTVKRVTLERSRLGEYYVVITTDAVARPRGKTHDGASVGIDFGLKTYLTMSDGTAVESPRYLRSALPRLRREGRRLSKSRSGSAKGERRRLALDRSYEAVVHRREDWQWKLAHELCRRYDSIFIEDLSLTGMSRLWGRKMGDLAHGEFVARLEHVASKYGVTVHKIDRFYPSSRTCTCGHVNKDLTLRDRRWICPACGKEHDRDRLAADNILRRGIAELESGCKSERRRQAAQRPRLHPRISRLQA